MRDKVTLSEKCIELATRVGDEEEPAAPDGGGGFGKAVQLAANMLRIGSEETYRSLETLIEQTPGIQDAFDIDDIPDYSTVCKWYQDLMMEVWRLLLRHRGGRALPVWFRFEVFREWIDHALNDTLGRMWEAPTNETGIPPTYSQLDAG